jgi:hypothetical protein
MLRCGLDLAVRLHRDAGLPPCRVILISTHSEQDYAELIAASPVVGFLSKSALSVGAIRDLLGGDGDGESAAPVNGPRGT